MPLFDDLDRFAVSARKLQQAATHTGTKPGAFTTAVLDRPLLELFRNADESESGLFIRTDSAAAGNVARKAVTTATPLRRAVKQEIPPEVYLEAALKYIRTYQSVQDLSQSRADVQHQLDRAARLRQNIKDMQQQLEKLDDAAPANLKPTLKDEEKRLRQLQTRVAQMTRRRDALKEQLARATRAAIAHAPEPLQDSSFAHPVHADDAEEESFWVPKTAAASDSDSLLDEELDVGGDSTILDAGSPLAAKHYALPPAAPPAARFHLPVPAMDDADDADEAETEGDSTVMLDRPPPAPPSTPPSAPRDEDFVPPSTVRQRAKVTPETERMVSKIWATLRDVLAPKSDAPFSARETIALLEALSSTAPPPGDDASSASSSGTELHQRLCARLLLALLRAPGNAVPLADLKAELAAAVVALGVTGLDAEGANVKAVYACVAKKAIRIDRGSREQLVRFAL